MNIDELDAKFRSEADDDIEDSYTWDKAEVLGFMNDAVDEGCRRKELLFDDSTDDVCLIDVSLADGPTYPIDSSIDHINTAFLVDDGGNYIYLKLVDRDALNYDLPLWREETGDPSYLLVDDTTMRIVPPPEIDYTLHLEVYRLPLPGEKMVLTPAETDPPADPPVVPSSPIIAANHHPYLHHWALHVAYNKRNMDKYDPKRSMDELAKFEAYFGPRRDVDRLRSTRENIPHHNKPW